MTRPLLAAARLAAAAALVVPPAAAAAQSLDDAMLVRPRELRASVEVAGERWDEYWEGRLRRDNLNIGTLDTRVVALSAAYGVSERVSLFATLPHVRTSASRGVLAGMSGWQDLTVGATLLIPCPPSTPCRS